MKKPKRLTPEWRSYQRAVLDIQRIIDEARRPWWRRVIRALRKRLS